MSAEMAQAGWLQQEAGSDPVEQAAVLPLIEGDQTFDDQPVVESASRPSVDWRGALARFGVVVGAALSAVGTLPATVAEAKPAAKLVMGQSIDGINIGQTEAQVRQEHGKPTYVYDKNNGSLVQWTYGRSRDLTMSFGIGNRVVDLELFDKRDRTDKGIGVGSSLAQVQKAYPSAKCAPHLSGNGQDPNYGPPGCVVETKHGGRTVDTAFVVTDPTKGVYDITMGLPAYLYS